MSGSNASTGPDPTRPTTAAGVPPGPLPAGLHRDEIVAEVLRALLPLPGDARAVVAVSGGPDSTALAYLAHEARPDLRLILGHVRHGLREDDADVAVVHHHGRALGLPVEVADVLVRPSGSGLEAAARAERYAALRRIGRRAGAGWLLVGHTADDQAETLLLRMTRGTGVTGLAGMAPVRGDLVRPLLRLRRNDVRRFVTLEGLDVADDPMNRDRTVRRVRVRLEVLPALSGLSPDPVGALARLADLARVDARRLDAEATALAAALIRRYGPAGAVPHEELQSLDPALAPRVVRQLLADVSGLPLPVSAAHIAAVLALGPGDALDVPGATVTSGGGWIAAVPTDLAVPPDVTVSVPGRTRWGAVEVQASVSDAGAAGQLALPLPTAWTPPTVEVLDEALPPGADVLLGQVVLPAFDTPLTARARRPGDRLTTGAGTKKVQDVLVDAGIPRAVRDLVPMVVADERIVWIPGIAVDHDAAAAGREDPWVHLAVTPGARPR